MKKAILMFCMVISLFATNAFGQEVRGVETRRVVYNDGPEYVYKVCSYLDPNNYCEYLSHEYYGFEFHNMNSVSVSVDIELYRASRLIATKSVVLKPDETYLFKRESSDAFKKGKSVDGKSIDSNDNISDYYVTYRAYKLQ